MPQDKSLATKPSTYSCHQYLLQQAHSVICGNRHHQVIYHDLQRERETTIPRLRSTGCLEGSKIIFAVCTLENTNNMTSNDSFNGICILLYRSGGV